MIEDAVYARMETEGETPADRIEAVLSAIFYVLRLIAATRGVKPEWIEENAGNVDAVRPRKYVPPTPEEIEARENEEARRQFAPILRKAKAALARGESSFTL